jgi:hypothetical protein
MQIDAQQQRSLDIKLQTKMPKVLDNNHGTEKQ